MRLFLFFIFLICVFSSVDDSVHLSDIKAQTFFKNRMTKSSRTTAIPQLNCERGCGDYIPEVVQCRNVGFDGNEYQWKCEAEMPEMYAFDGPVEVSCEGYDYSGDQNVLKGSCGLYFSIKEVSKLIPPVTSETVEKVHSTRIKSPSHQNSGSFQSEKASVGALSFFLFIVFIIFMCYCCCRRKRTPRTTHTSSYTTHQTTTTTPSMNPEFSGNTVPEYSGSNLYPTPPQPAPSRNIYPTPPQPTRNIYPNPPYQPPQPQHTTHTTNVHHHHTRPTYGTLESGSGFGSGFNTGYLVGRSTSSNRGSNIRSDPPVTRTTTTKTTTSSSSSNSTGGVKKRTAFGGTKTR